MTKAPQIYQPADVRAQVFEVTVRQALMDALWRAICAGPMVVSQITESEVEEEVRRRRGDEPQAPVKVPPPPPPQGDSSIQTALPLPNPEWQRLKLLLKDLAGKDDMEREAKITHEGNMSREPNRTRVDLSQKQPPGPHHFNWGNDSCL